jgi:hypothetical protein
MLKWFYNFWLVRLWRDAPPEITTWGKIWRTVLLLGFWVVAVYFLGWSILIDGGGPDEPY